MPPFPFNESRQMKPYPEIPAGPRKGVPVFVFDKLDGSNIRVEWSKKRGFYKFGRRHGLLDDSNPILRDEAPGLILDRYGDDLARIFRKQRWDRIIAFSEFYGPNSFAGNHEAEPHVVTLLDVNVHRRGILEPGKFLNLFEDVPAGVPRVLHHGNFTADLKEEVQEGTLEGMTFEGVVAKGKNISPGQPLMFKWKNYAWLRKLKNYCGENMKLYNQMM